MYEQQKLDSGKAPPSAIDLEQIVLGAIMVDTRGSEVIHILQEDFFFKHQHRLIFAAIKRLYEQGIGIDIMSVTYQLRATGDLEMTGGEYYLIQISQMVSSSAHIEYHSRIIIQKYVLRRIIGMSSQAMEEAYGENPDIFDLLNSIEDEINDIYRVSAQKEYDSEDLAKIAQARFEKAKLGESVGVATGINNIDEKTGGLMPSEFWILAGRPSMGKTSVALFIAMFMAITKGKKVVFISLEMTKLQLYNKIISANSEIPYESLRQYKISDADMDHVKFVYKWLDNSTLVVLDGKSKHTKNLSAIRKYVSQSGSDILILDYLQLISLDGKTKKSSFNREQEVSEISRTMKAIAMENDIPVLALSQMSRDVEKRKGGNRRPQLSDLRESGALEQDADGVIFTYRPAYYDELDGKKVNEIEKGNLTLIVAKGREVGTGDYNNHIDFKTNKIEEGFKFPKVEWNNVNIQNQNNYGQ